MSKKIFLICNAHIDPVWQWEWEEGAAEALSTFRVAADFCEQYDGFVFNHNESLLYKWVEEFEPELFERIKALVKSGKWHIMGGWHVQPDCNMPSGEGFVRQIKSGRRYFAEKFGAYPTTAINFDPFGHSRGLVQIMKKCGYDSYLFVRPNGGFLKLPAELFKWEGYDGSYVIAERHPTYASSLGGAVDKINDTVVNACPEDGIKSCLWGVGDHGGGASRADLEKISALKKELAEKDVELVHSTPEEYFSNVRARNEELPTFAAEMNPWAPGCYTSMVRVKQQYRLLENLLWTTERMASAAEANGFMEYPAKELEKAEYDLLTVQFHDMLPGSSVQQGEEMALRMLSHGTEILSRARLRAFFALSGGQKKPDADVIPILIYNPHPFSIEGDFVCEMMLWDQNWGNYFNYPRVEQNGVVLPTQCEKENSTIKLDWRKRVVFHATLEPMQMNRFDCRFDRIPARLTPTAEQDDNYFYLSNNRVKARISKTTGYLDSYLVDGTELLKAGCELAVIKDNCDPWGMNVTSFTEYLDSFKLLSPSAGAEFCGVSGIIPAVHCIESGAVRTTIESTLGYGNSRANVQYSLSENDTSLKINIRVQWAEKQRMLKFRIPTGLNNPECLGQTAYGVESLPVNGRENCSQKYLILADEKNALSVCNDGLYGSDTQDGVLGISLLRSPVYCAHPISGDIIPQDRFAVHMDQGERLFTFELTAGERNEVINTAPRRAAVFNEVPVVLSFFPPQGKTQPKAPLCVSGDEVEITALKKADDENGYIVRLFNPTDKDASVTLKSDLFGYSFDAVLTKYEIKSYRLTGSSHTEVSLLEEDL